MPPGQAVQKVIPGIKPLAVPAGQASQSAWPRLLIIPALSPSLHGLQRVEPLLSM
jgi:hypothetical protein